MNADVESGCGILPWSRFVSVPFRVLPRLVRLLDGIPCQQ